MNSQAIASESQIDGGGSGRSCVGAARWIPRPWHAARKLSTGSSRAQLSCVNDSTALARPHSIWATTISLGSTISVSGPIGFTASVPLCVDPIHQL